MAAASPSPESEASSDFASSAGDAFGWSLASAGDVDGDGCGDVIVGAPGDDALARDAGALYVFSGRTGARLFEIHGNRPGGRLGTSVGGLGDVDGDGKPDVFGSGLDGTHGVLQAFRSPVLDTCLTLPEQRSRSLADSD